MRINTTPKELLRTVTSGAWAPLVSGVLLSLAFQPLNLVWLLPFVLTPLLASLEGVSNRQAWKRGYLFGFVFGLFQLHWLYALVEKWTGSALLGAVPWVIATLLMAIYFGIFGMLCRVCWAKGWVWAIPIVWAGIEVFRSFIPVLAFPWALLAMPLAAHPWLIQSAHFGTIYLMSAWVLAVNLVLLLVIRQTYKPTNLQSSEPTNLQTYKLTILVGVCLALLLFSAALWARRHSTESIPITIGQTAVDMAFGAPGGEARLNANVNDFVLAAKGAKSRLLVLPEGIARGGAHLPPTLDFQLDPSVPTIFGGQRGDKVVYQSAYAYDGTWQVYDKTRLVIFGEFVPGRNVLPFLNAFHLPSGDLTPGQDGVKAVTVGGLRVGPVLCFESLFPEICYQQGMNGSRLLAVMSIDDWFMNSTEPETLRQSSIWRAVETGLPVARAASLGYSLAVDGKGNVLAEAPLGKPAALHVNLPVPTEPVTWPLLPAFPLLSLISIILAPLAARVTRPKPPVPSTLGP